MKPLYLRGRDWMSLTGSFQSQAPGTLISSLEQHEVWVPGSRAAPWLHSPSCLAAFEASLSWVGVGVAREHRAWSSHPVPRAERTSGTDPIGLVLFAHKQRRKARRPSSFPGRSTELLLRDVCAAAATYPAGSPSPRGL